jgi:hypothetical protein
MTKRIVFPRTVLLVEIERRCSDPACNARVRVGLTKDEARAYTGFVCERCDQWTEDLLDERDIPDWWEELKLTSLEALRPLPASESEELEASDTVERMSKAWRQIEEDGGEGGDKGSI